MRSARIRLTVPRTPTGSEIDSASAVQTNFTAKVAAERQTQAHVTEIATDIQHPGETIRWHDPRVRASAYSRRRGAWQLLQRRTATLPTRPAYVTQFTTSRSSRAWHSAAGWSQLSQLVGFLGSAAGIMQSADSASVSSSGTVVSTTQPFQYDVKLTAPAGGYIVPSAFSLTFPAGLGVNTALVADEVNAAANGTSAAAIAAVEANPSGTSIGTVTLTSPLADEFGGSNNQFVGKIYAVTTGASSGQGSATQPYLELWFTGGIYDLGSFPSSLAFPLTLNFGEATVTGLGQEPLPINSLELNFPAATSPVKSSSCTTLGTAGGTTTDAIAGLAFEFGDPNDGVSSATGTAAAVTLAASPTAVTNNCVTNSATGSMGGLTSASPTMTLKIRTTTSFGTVKVGLPKGLSFVKSKKLAKEVSSSSGKVKSVKIAGGQLVITLKSKVTSTTIKTRKGAIHETAALIKSIKKHKTKKFNVSIHAGSISLKASIKA